MGKTGITLTLAELKEYFRIWHENHFNDLHKSQMMDFINSYLNKEGLLSTITDINDLQKSIVKLIRYMIKIIDGGTNSALSDSSSISAAINELNTKASINFASINLLNLNSRITSNSEAINTINNNINKKADISYVDEITGAKPKQLQEQDISSNSDLNEYIAPGLYKSKTSSITQTLQNIPPSNSNSKIKDAFVLMVIPHFDFSVRQILLTGEKNNNGNKIYTRNYHSGWSDWYELYGEHNLTPLQMQVEWENGGSTVYTLLKK